MHTCVLENNVVKNLHSSPTLQSWSTLVIVSRLRKVISFSVKSSFFWFILGKGLIRQLFLPHMEEGTGVAGPGQALDFK